MVGDVTVASGATPHCQWHWLQPGGGVITFSSAASVFYSLLATLLAGKTEVSLAKRAIGSGPKKSKMLKCQPQTT